MRSFNPNNLPKLQQSPTTDKHTHVAHHCSNQKPASSIQNPCSTIQPNSSSQLSKPCILTKLNHRSLLNSTNPLSISNTTPHKYTHHLCKFSSKSKSNASHKIPHYTIRIDHKNTQNPSTHNNTLQKTPTRIPYYLA